MGPVWGKRGFEGGLRGRASTKGRPFVFRDNALALGEDGIALNADAMEVSEEARAPRRV